MKNKELIGGLIFLTVLMLAVTIPAAVISGHPAWYGVVATLAIVAFAAAFGAAGALVIIGMLKRRR